MQRTQRLIINDETAVYHVMSGTARDGFPLGDIEKVGFARYYIRQHNRRDYFWGDRFKSVIVENGQTLINCLAYLDGIFSLKRLADS
jgi:hypothetical protein